MQTKSKAEERRREWLTRQAAADQATVLDAVKDELRQDEMKTAERVLRLREAREAVVKAAMACWRWYKEAEHGIDLETLTARRSAACAALDKLERAI